MIHIIILKPYAVMVKLNHNILPLKWLTFPDAHIGATTDIQYVTMLPQPYSGVYVI